jgi:dimethylhistidine N-methyltransferase
LAARFPSLEVYPLVRNFENLYPLPASISTAKKIGFFPGSTIGNFAPPDAISLLHAMLTALSKDSRLIVGVDLKKDVGTLLRAYDDARGVTAAFNLNLLARMNRELDAKFALDAFRHKALYNAVEGRIEMHLVSLYEQEVQVQGCRFQFRPGETIHTENSYKFTVAGFQHLARLAGWMPGRVWLDADALFSVHELTAP